MYHLVELLFTGILDARMPYSTLERRVFFPVESNIFGELGMQAKFQNPRTTSEKGKLCKKYWPLFYTCNAQGQFTHSVQTDNFFSLMLKGVTKKKSLFTFYSSYRFCSHIHSEFLLQHHLSIYIASKMKE